MLCTFVHIGAQVLVFRIGFKARITLAFVADWLIDADVGARVDGLAFIDIWMPQEKRQEKSKEKLHQEI